MVGLAVGVVCLLLSAVPAVVFLRNLALYAPPGEPPTDGERPQVSILIPARNEAAVIEESARAALASVGIDHEVIVLDDHSDDDTAARVLAIAESDPRLRLERSPPLPPGWCGKQHACATLAERARHDLLLFLDADVRLAPDGVARAVHFLRSSGAGLVSGVPRQLTVTALERLLIPLIHFVLLGFLPIHRMRRSALPAYGAGCGQFFLTTRAAYRQSGGHASVRGSLHDGVTLPRAYRSAGVRTDLFDATSVAACRMYRSARDVWHGLGKNATEGFAAPGLIVPATVILLVGQALPLPLAVAGALGLVTPSALVPALGAVWFSYVPRLTAVVRFRQPLSGALLHPLGVLAFLAIQWTALARHLAGRPARWKDRSYAKPGEPATLRVTRS